MFIISFPVRGVVASTAKMEVIAAPVATAEVAVVSATGELLIRMAFAGTVAVVPVVPVVPVLLLSSLLQPVMNNSPERSAVDAESVNKFFIKISMMYEYECIACIDK